jgi:hypothetical protein
LQTAKELLNVINAIEKNCTLSFTQSYIGIKSSNGYLVFWLCNRKNSKSLLCFRERENVEQIEKLFETSSIRNTYSNHEFSVEGVDKDFISTHKNLLRQIHEIRYLVAKIDDEVTEN